MSRLAELRRLSPVRPLTRAEAFRVAERQAERLLSSAGISRPPVPESLITDLPDVKVDYWPDAPVSGSSHWTGTTWIIVVNADEPLVRRRFSLAHELHHILDHPHRDVLYKNQRPPNRFRPEETVANHFAASLLMPRRWIRRAWTRDGITTVHELASLFEVSPTAMHRRLVYLGLIDDTLHWRMTA